MSDLNAIINEFSELVEIMSEFTVDLVGFLRLEKQKFEKKLQFFCPLLDLGFDQKPTFCG